MTARAAQLEDLDCTRCPRRGAQRQRLDASVACFAPDAVQMPRNDPPNIGTDHIRTWSSGMLAAFGAEFSLDIDEVELAGDDWAFERGTYTIALTPKAGGTPSTTRANTRPDPHLCDAVARPS
ncbi:MAG: YybH family protein [Solirubrobacteraceae bacterium]